jgi:hypothetical protein
MYIGMIVGEIRAWIGVRTYDEDAVWGPGQTLALPTPPDEPATPLPNAPVLSADETKLFVSSATTTFARFTAFDGTIDWEVDVGDLTSCEAKVSPEDLYVYTIQVSSHDDVSMKDHKMLIISPLSL